ncbi:M56 family metallopeptidase [Stigmatella erecta]|uniref:Signal transducer regulating beta-lactamase production, contains metallopeptidase domain n=1 Tax=Stigmatella erecta TaxID=83460 RepID=A0A1I0KLR2_9BACT|nr:M56 family metallopeptidase [Stigmatella erecta]SEU25134.1 Signal transducer regulating beta-lactamase production, contains metallopeptidase domain [Stigmatella erecta]
MRELILESLGWALLHLVWQGALVAAVLALGLRLLGPRAAARYGLACGALGLMLLLPAATGWQHLRARQAPAAVSSLPALSGQSSLAPASRAGAAPASSPAASLRARATAFTGGLLPWGVLAWGLGVAGSSLRLLAGWVRLRRRVREAFPAPEAWQLRLEALARRLGVKREVRLLQSPTLEVPSALGWLRPVVLLPVSTLTGLPARQLEMILAHELAHIRRHDFAVNLLQTVVETLLFYHPAVWWMSHVIRVERENCCDDAAAGLTGNALSYARALTALEALRVMPSPAPAPALSALGGSLPERVRRLVAAPPSRCASRWTAGASVLVLMSSLAAAAPLTARVLPAQAPRSLLAASPATPAEPPAAPAPSASPAPAPAPHGAPQPNPAPAPRPSAVPSPHEASHAGEDALPGDSHAKPRRIVPTKPRKDGGQDPALQSLLPSGITEAYAKGLQAHFEQPLSSEELFTLKHLGVTAEEVDALKRLGFSEVVPDTVAAAHAVGATEAYLRALKDAGYTDLEKATGMRALGITPETLTGLARAGFTGLSADTLMGFQATGVTPAFIEEMRAQGHEPLTPEALIRLRLGKQP